MLYGPVIFAQYGSIYSFTVRPYSLQPEHLSYLDMFDTGIYTLYYRNVGTLYGLLFTII